MADQITSNPITRNEIDLFKTRWGTTVYDYSLNGASVDFQDLMVAISEHRATAVEAEVGPLSTRMRNRNAYLEKLGTALSEASQKQATFKSDDSGDKAMPGWFSEQTTNVIQTECSSFIYSWNDSHTQCDATKSGIDGIVSKLKSVIDSLNNESQTDMTRLQSLVDRRDESYTTATTLMTNVSDTRDNAIRNM